MVYNTWLASSLDYADKTQLATTTQCRPECSRTILFRVLLNYQVCSYYVCLVPRHITCVYRDVLKVHSNIVVVKKQ